VKLIVAPRDALDGTIALDRLWQDHTKERPASYLAWLPLGQTVSLAVQRGDARSEPRTVTVTDELEELTLALKRD
jgi:hypothetical protein